MPYVIERYFEEASRRIPASRVFTDRDSPWPIYPRCEDFDLAERDRDYGDHRPPGEEMRQYEASSEPLVEQEALSPITSDERDLVDGAIRTGGFDVLAFYKSLRCRDVPPCQGKWGIFYLAHGVARIQELIEAACPGCGSSLTLAYEFLRQHERYHLKFDLYALSAEAATGRALYEPLKHAFRHHLIDQAEEALANQDAWLWAKQKHVGLRDFAGELMALQPGAYARFRVERTELNAELAANLLDLNISPGARRKDQEFWVGMVPKELRRKSLCPEFLVRPTALTAWIDRAWRLPQVLNIIEAPSLTKKLATTHASSKKAWENTKRKLIENPARPGLNFKPWDRTTGHWSVRINDNMRAHLRPISQGTWEADDLDTHYAMGHG